VPRHTLFAVYLAKAQRTPSTPRKKKREEKKEENRKEAHGLLIARKPLNSFAFFAFLCAFA
jgi:hypothetical protein